MAEPLTVLFIARAVTIHARRWIGAVAERGVRCLLAAVTSPGEPERIEGAETVAVLPVRGIRHPAYLPRFLANTLRLRRAIDRTRPAVVHAHFVEDCGWLGAFSGYHPWGVTAWGSDLLVLPDRSRLGVGRRLTRTALRRADFLTAPSQALLEAADRQGLRSGLGTHLLWGVDRGRFHPDLDPAPFRSRLRIPDGVPLVLSPRRMEGLYHIVDILDAWERLRAAGGPRSVLALATDGGSLEPDFRTRAAASEWEEDIRILEPLAYDEMPGLFAATDIVVSVPESDGTPMSVLEALATGTPVIAGDLPSLHPWVHEGKTGRLVPVGDVTALADVLGALLADVEERHEMGRRAAEHAVAEADQTVWMDRAVALYHDLAGGSRSSRTTAGPASAGEEGR